MDITEYYVTLNRIASRSPKLFGRTQYIVKLGFEVNPSLYGGENFSEFFRNSVLKEDFIKLEDNLLHKNFTGIVEDFYVKSYMGNNILLGSFSDFGVDSKYLAPFISKTPVNIFKERLNEASTYVLMEDLAFWFLSHQWNAKINEVDLKKILELLRPNADSEYIPILEILSSIEEKYFNQIVELNPKKVEDLLNHKPPLNSELLAQTVKRFWQWDDQYYYGDLSQTYKYLRHPFLPYKNFMEPLFVFNTSAANLSTGYKKSILSPHVVEFVNLDSPLTFTSNAESYVNTNNLKEVLTETCDDKCTSCGNTADTFLETGHIVKVVEKNCFSCFEKYHNLRKAIISSAADHWTHFSSAFLILLENRKYNVLSEAQLIGLAMEFPSFKDEILAAGNATENVAAVFALNLESSS